MKRLVTFAIAFSIVAAAAPAQAGFGVKVKAGYSWISYGGFNDWVDDLNRETPVGSPTVDNINWVPEISAEFTFPIVPTFSGSVGIGYFSGKSDYSVSVASESFSFVNEISATPVLLNVYWEPPLMVINPFVYGGIGMYRTTYDVEYWITSGIDRVGYTAEMDKWGFGLQAGGGVSIALIPTISFDVGVQGRWADVQGFEGTATNQDGETKDIYLAEYDGYFGPEEVGSDQPEGSVDLSGFTFFIGMTFGF